MAPSGNGNATEFAATAPRASVRVVVLGASAGGLAAITYILRDLGETPGFAVVVIQHLDPTHPSSLVALLSKVTSMPVATVHDGTPVLIDRVYVIPPAAAMTIEHGILHITPRSNGPAPHLPIDAFLDGLADDLGEQAVGVVLSGTGSDGAHGVRAIKGGGGITFAQEGAEHTGMPQSAIATGCIDFVLPAAGIATELLRMVARPAHALGTSAGDDMDLERIVSTIRRETGVDFANYKPAALRRRIQRRATLRRIESLHDYANLVRAEPSEAATLSEEVLIHVTSFFRDPEMFAALKKEVLPRLLTKGRTDAIRVWAPGCSTGEEVYSLAIALSEFLSDAGAAHIPVKMFGTDVGRRAVDRARRGIYPENIAADVSIGRLARFFRKTERGYEVLKELRDRCVFATHDIARDSPFSKMDFVSCRNLMIYLEPALQQRVLSAFHYAIKEPGFLVLGSAESVGSFVGFSPIDSKNRIFKRSAGPVRVAFDFGNARTWPFPADGAMLPVQRATSAADVRRDADRAILGAVAPVGVVVTDDLAIVEFRGDISPYLEPIPGVASLDLLRMAREELRLTLRRLVGEARTTGKPVRSARATIASKSLLSGVDIDVVPFDVGAAGRRFFAILFTEGVPSPHIAPAAPPDDARVAIDDSLRSELASTREYLQSVIEQLEGGNEELRAANEEIVSSNEELQSTNEELQTAKEELQATNEELRTVNEEMLERNIEATRLADDLSNVLSSVAIPIVILGRDSRIRRFTPAIKKLFELTAADIDRPITEVRAKIQLPELAALIAGVLDRLGPLERVVQADDGRWFQLSVRPYITLDHRVDGTILSAYDIDSLKKAELLLAEARDYAESIVDTMSECFIVLDAGLHVRTVNRAFCEWFKTSPDEIAGKRFEGLYVRPSDASQIGSLLEGLGRGETVGELRFESILPEMGVRMLAIHGRRMSSGSILLTIADITDRVEMDRARTEDQVARNEAGFRRMLTSAGEAIVMSDSDGRLVFANETASRIFGYSGGTMVGIPMVDLLPSLVTAGVGDRVARRKDGTEFPSEVAWSHMEGSGGSLAVAFVVDVTARRETEWKIKDYQAKLQRMAFEAALAEERERRRIAQDLHDRVGQALALARMKLEGVRAEAVGDIRDAIVATIELIAASIEDARTLTFELAPPVLYDLGFKSALSWLSEDIEKRSGVRVEIIDDGSAAPFEQATAALLFRAVRELLTNVFKHAHASSAQVVLQRAGDHFEIRVEDSGAGFELEQLSRDNAGFGLFSVREQIARLGGTVDIESTLQRGTRVSLRVPIQEEPVSIVSSNMGAPS